MADNSHTTPTATRRSLLASVTIAACAAPAIAAAHADQEDPDGKLLRLCAAHAEAERQYRRLCINTDNLPVTAAVNQAEAEIDAMMPGYHETIQAIAETPAHTEQGRLAKARMIVRFYAPNSGEHHATNYERDCPIEHAIWSLIEDVAGRA